MAKKRFLKIDSTELAEDTADLTDAEFRAFILIQAWGNECMYHEHSYILTIARNRLPSVAPNRRGSVATSARVVRELSAKRAWGVLEEGARWVISTGKCEQNQGSEALIRKEKKKKKREKRKESAGPPHVCMVLATKLDFSIHVVQPERRLMKTLDAWAKVYEAAMRIDGRSAPDLNAQIDWLFGPENQSAEARFEVFSANAHRMKFDAIERMRQRNSRPAQKHPDKMDKMAAEVQRQEDLAHGRPTTRHNEFDEGPVPQAQSAGDIVGDLSRKLGSFESR